MLNPEDRFKENISKQEVFDHVVSHLASMTDRCMAAIGGLGLKCAYRGPDGNSCAAGYLMSDGEYLSEMENSPIGQIISGANLIRLRPHRELVEALQETHDQEKNWKEDKRRLKSKLREVATAFGVSPAIIDEVTWVSPTSLYIP